MRASDPPGDGLRDTPRVSAECRLVYLAAGMSSDARQRAALTALARQPLDWARVVVIAEGEKAVPVLWRALEGLPGSTLPVPLAEHMRRSAMVNDFRMLYLEGRLRTTLAALHAAGVPVMLLKGAALGASLYAMFTERPMADVDLLVRPEDAARARLAIIESGWPETTDPVLLDMLTDEHHLPPFLDPGATGLRIELHTMLLPRDQPFAISEEEWWRESRPAARLDATARVGSPRYLLLHACLHYAWAHTMGFGAWRTFRDVNVLVHAPDFDWDSFVALAIAAKGASSCHWTLWLAARLSGAPVPGHVLARLAPPLPEMVHAALERHFITAMTPGEGPSCPSIRLADQLWRLAIRPGWSGHPRSARSDQSHRWAHALGRVTSETGTQRLRRHLGSARHWWRFTTRTLLSAVASPPPPGRATPQ